MSKNMRYLAFWAWLISFQQEDLQFYPFPLQIYDYDMSLLPCDFMMLYGTVYFQRSDLVGLT
jgi:hypothetical protein